MQRCRGDDDDDDDEVFTVIQHLVKLMMTNILLLVLTYWFAQSQTVGKLSFESDRQLLWGQVAIPRVKDPPPPPPTSVIYRVCHVVTASQLLPDGKNWAHYRDGGPDIWCCSDPPVLSKGRRVIVGIINTKSSSEHNWWGLLPCGYFLPAQICLAHNNSPLSTTWEPNGNFYWTFDRIRV